MAYELTAGRGPFVAAGVRATLDAGSCRAGSAPFDRPPRLSTSRRRRSRRGLGQRRSGSATDRTHRLACAAVRANAWSAPQPAVNPAARTLTDGNVPPPDSPSVASRGPAWPDDGGKVAGEAVSHEMAAHGARSTCHRGRHCCQLFGAGLGASLLEVRTVSFPNAEATRSGDCDPRFHDHGGASHQAGARARCVFDGKRPTGRARTGRRTRSATTTRISRPVLHSR